METIYKEKIQNVHRKNNEWKNRLALYKDELAIFNERLSEFLLKNRSEEILKKIEMFQNKFIIQKNEIDKLEHKINIIEDNAIYSGRIHIRRISYKRTAKFMYVTNAMKQFEKLFQEMKQEFYSYLSKYFFI